MLEYWYQLCDVYSSTVTELKRALNLVYYVRQRVHAVLTKHPIRNYITMVKTLVEQGYFKLYDKTLRLCLCFNDASA